jgi:hypothetical protein
VACVTRKHHFEPVVNQQRKTMEGVPVAEKEGRGRYWRKNTTKTLTNNKNYKKRKTRKR